MKMKTLAVVALVGVLAGCENMQPIQESSKTFDRVVEAPGFTKDQLYNGSKMWIAESFKSAKDVIEHHSKEDGVIIGNGVIPYPCTGMECSGRDRTKVPFTMKVETKDNRFRLTFSNIKIDSPEVSNGGFLIVPAMTMPMNNQGELDAIKPVLLHFGDEILASMSNNKANSNW